MNSFASISQLLGLSYIGNEAADRRNIESAIERLLTRLSEVRADRDQWRQWCVDAKARLATVEAERDAARAEVARLDDLFMQAEGIAPDGELGISAAKVQQWYDDSQALKAAQAGEARAVEALKKWMDDGWFPEREDVSHSPDCTCRYCDTNRLLDLTEEIVGDEAQPALDWLAQVNREAIAEWLDAQAEADNGERADIAPWCREQAAALRAGKGVGDAE